MLPSFVSRTTRSAKNVIPAIRILKSAFVSTSVLTCPPSRCPGFAYCFLMNCSL